MDKKTAFSFLKKNQPFPEDKRLTESELNLLDEVRKYFSENLDEKCLPLILNMFGEGNGQGIYQLIEDLLLKYPKDVVLFHLVNALKSDCRSVQYWNAQIAANFPDSILIKPLTDLLNIGDFDIKYAAITALEQIDNDLIKDILLKHLKNEREVEIIELINNVLTSKK